MLEKTYTVTLINSKGQESILSVKGKTHFKSKSTAIRHCDEMLTLIQKGKTIFDCVDSFVEDMTGNIVHPKQ